MHNYCCTITIEQYSKQCTKIFNQGKLILINLKHNKCIRISKVLSENVNWSYAIFDSSW